MTSISAKPRWDSPACRIGMSRSLSPEKALATNVAPTLSAMTTGSIGGSRFGSPFFDFELMSADAEN